MAETQGPSGFPWLRVANVLLFTVAFALAIQRQAWIGAAVIGIFLVLAIVILAAGVLQRTR